MAERPRRSRVLRGGYSGLHNTDIPLEVGVYYKIVTGFGSSCNDWIELLDILPKRRYKFKGIQGLQIEGTIKQAQFQALITDYMDLATLLAPEESIDDYIVTENDEELVL